MAKVWKQPHIEHNVLTQWNWVVAYPEGLVMRRNTDIGAFTYINAKHGVFIGEGVKIGGGCHIYSENTINGTKGKVIIKKGAKIGAHCVILPNVIIKEGQEVKAGSVVSK